MFKSISSLKVILGNTSCESLTHISASACYKFLLILIENSETSFQLILSIQLIVTQISAPSIGFPDDDRINSMSLFYKSPAKHLLQ